MQRSVLFQYLFLLGLFFTSATPCLGAENARPVVSLSHLTNGLSLGVIPSVALGGALAVLAALFPALFGGLLIMLRKWVIFFTVASLNSCLFFIYRWFGSYFAGKAWATPYSLWILMTAITLLGTFWSWKRSFGAGFDNKESTLPPNRWEWILLGVGSLTALATLGFFWIRSAWLPSPLAWKSLLVLAAGIWAGLLHLLIRSTPVRIPRIPTEGLTLWAMVFAAAGLTVAWPHGNKDSLHNSMQGSLHGVHALTENWKFMPPGTGTMESTPLVHGDQVFVAASQTSILGKVTGKVFCLDRKTGLPQWQFDAGGNLKSVFSSPCLADGRLYFGEGFHQDVDCHLYCLDASNGHKLWEFKTAGHTESSPAVAAGKVYFGAGDDGLYCLNAITGDLIWHFADRLHVDANPVVHGNRLYCGSGVGDIYNTLEIFCLDAETGKPQWRVPVDLPLWGSAAVWGDTLYIGLGNGNFLISDDRPRGALLSVNAGNGEIQWRYDGPTDGVLVQPAVDGRNVYFASRDGFCYCLDRSEGFLIWKKNLESPVVASPCLIKPTPKGLSQSLVVASTEGLVLGLDPATGMVQWSEDYSPFGTQLLASPVVWAERIEASILTHQIFISMSVNSANTPVLYCLRVAEEE